MLDAVIHGWFFWPAAALVAGVLALAPLGAQVLARGVVFIDLAVAQAAALGVMVANALFDHPGSLPSQAAATAGALLCAGLVATVVRRWPAQREALIGLVYVAGATGALLAARAGRFGAALRSRATGDVGSPVCWVRKFWYLVGLRAPSGLRPVPAGWNEGTS